MLELEKFEAKWGEQIPIIGRDVAPSPGSTSSRFWPSNPKSGA